jgi:hypothetical protein
MELIALLWALAEVLAIIFVFLLTFADLLGWFETNDSLIYEDAENIAFTLQEKLSTGKYETVQGIFNKREKNIVKGRKVKSDKVDEKIAAKHVREELVVYE